MVDYSVLIYRNITGLEVIPFASNLHAVPLPALWQPVGR
jgi:hypothetical protein